MAQPDKPEKEHPVHEDHPGKGRGENPNPGNQPDKPEHEPTPHPEHPIVLPEEDDEPHPEQLPS
jgi:hypothetical protein